MRTKPLTNRGPGAGRTGTNRKRSKSATSLASEEEPKGPFLPRALLMAMQDADDRKVRQQRKCEHEPRLDPVARQLLEALKLVEPMAATLIDELAHKGAANWGIVNSALCAVAAAIAKAEGR